MKNKKNLYLAFNITKIFVIGCLFILISGILLNLFIKSIFS